MRKKKTDVKIWNVLQSNNNCQTVCLRLLRTFAGVLGKKIRMRDILKEDTANYISLESLINVDFREE